MSCPGVVRRLPRAWGSRSRPAWTLATLFVFVLLGGSAREVRAAKLVDVGVLDRDYLIVHLSDGEVLHDEGGAGETVVRHTPELDANAAVQTASWTLRSSEDPSYGGVGLHPQSCHRKTKLSGHAQMEWVGGDYRYESTYDHWIYLRLPSPLQQGMTYTLDIAAATHSDSASESFTFDVFHSRSEAVHVNLVGYAPEATHKAADLYHWMGDGGARDYSPFEGSTVYVYDVATGEAHPAGLASFWRVSGSDVGWYNLTRSDVWTVDFSSFTEPGTYRLVVEGVGCSPDFEITSDVYRDPFRVSLRGYYYMRIGEQNPTGISPPPRTPLYIPGASPATTAVYLTTMQPWHQDWESFSAGDVWDGPDAWAPYRKPGNPTNPDAWGGHSDAADWDRHLGHIANVYDMLLPFLLTDGAIRDDDTGITESGNGIPDILDEARWEVDFWLRLRDGDGYSHGLTNPNGSNELFQAGPTAIAAWANAAAAAMLADTFRIAGLTSLMEQYREAAATAYDHANGLSDPMLDEGLELDDGLLRGRDLKMTAAAFLYNVTGATTYENVVQAESVCSDGPATLKDGSRNQIYGSAAYLITPQPVHYPTLQDDMTTAILGEARSTEAELADSRPSRRATDQLASYFRTGQNVQRSIIAHAVAEDPADRDFFRRALALEADWGLGRNPLNMIQMTTASTPLASRRSVTEAYTSGVNDGVQGVHPGHTPYMNLDDWAPGMTMGRPSALFENGHPSNVKSTWPIGEAYFPSRWVWAHNEFTPRQTMRGKMALYGYLYGLAAAPLPTTSTLVVNTAGTGSGTVTSSPPGIDCGSDCAEVYDSGTSVDLTATPDGDSSFAGWSGGCFGTGPCTLTMTQGRSVTATFEPEGLTYTLSVSRSGTGGGSVASSPPGISCGTSCDAGFLAGTNVTLNAAADGGSTFTGWGGACSGTGSCTVAMNAGRSVTASFRSNTIPTVVIYDDVLAGGWDDWSWNATIDLAGTAPVHAGTHAANVTLAGWGGFSPAMPNGTIDTFGYDALRFWVHGGAGSSKVLRVSTENDGVASAAVDVTAAADTWTEITVSLSELGSPALIDRLNFFNNSPDALSTVTFDEIRLEPDTSSTQTLTVGSSGNGSGRVTSSPSGIDCGTDCSEAYATDTSVTLTASAASGSTFAGWTGACSGTGTCTVTMDSAKSVTAAFNSYAVRVDDVATTETDVGTTTLSFTVMLESTVTDSFALTVNRAGSGIGSVVTSPAGIACGSGCSAPFPAGASVTLTPLAASGSSFTGWSGACAGTEACTVTMSDARTVTATFDGPAAVPGALRWVGRVDASDPDAVRFAWQGAGFVATVSGPTVSVSLETTATPTVFFQPVVDGLPGRRFEVPQGGVQTVTLATGLDPGDHVIELYRETEGMYGVSTFRGFVAGTLTGAPSSSGRRLEVVGDSISAGYGNLGVEPHPDWVANPACGWTAENSSWYQTYAAVAGRTLGAEVSTVARSGWGMSRDRDGDAAGVLPSVYENAIGTQDSTPWGFEPPASVVVVNLGTNDINRGDPGTAYETAYVDFLQDVRSRYPDAWIFATIGSMLGGAELDSINAHLANVVAALGDDRVVTFDLGTQDLGENGEIPTGCDWHPNVADHARMAEILEARLRTHLGW